MYRIHYELMKLTEFFHTGPIEFANNKKVLIHTHVFSSKNEQLDNKNVSKIVNLFSAFWIERNLIDEWSVI